MKPLSFIMACVCASLLLLFSSCDGDQTPEEEVKWDETPYVLEHDGFAKPPIAEDNPLTIQGVKLGRMLFYEKKLSADNSQACATCHMQEFAFSDTAKFSEGVRGLKGKRQAMAAFNMAWNTNEFFWDGRAHLLRDQSLKPIQDELEMDETLENVVKKLEAEQDYKDQFKRAFGTEEITAERMSLAMEQFMNSIVSNNSKYDQYKKGQATLTESEDRGRKLFFTEYNPFFPDDSGADCAHCHGGDNFENDQYMNNGINAEADITDIGRKKVTEDENDLGKMKVPTLRNVEVTHPYMHDGRFATLEQVVEHYNSGIKPSSTLDGALEQTREKGLMLTDQDKQDLVAFLKTLTDKTLLENEAYSDPFE
ncbi:MAG: c-type cytochrome [Bacteroidetes bacterium]|nr:c-type cytochrome [Bacteroidota bacterium]